MKKILMLLLSGLLLVSTLPIIAAAEEATENIALGKPATASSSQSYSSPSNAFDGDINNFWVRGTYAGGEYIQVDLGEAYRITQVVLHNRLDINEENYRRLVNLEFSNTPDFSVKEKVEALGNKAAPYGEPVEIKIDLKTPYRYVRAVKQDTFIFVLAEMEVYGYLVDPNAKDLGADVPGSMQESAISVLTHLGLVNNVNEDIFGVDHLLTRGEATDMVVDAFGGNVSFSGYLPFSDVEKDHPNYESIMSAYHLGYITGDCDTSFRPDDYITKTELMYMTLRAIGYGEVVQVLYDNSVTRLLQQVEALNLLKDVPTENYNEPVSRGDAATVFYNALLAPAFNLYAFQQGHLVVEEDMTLLEKKYNKVIQQGIVDETRRTTLNGAVKNNKNAVSINGTDFRDPEGVLDKYLGQSVYFMTDADDNSILLAWPTKKNEEVVIHASNLISTIADIEAGRIRALETDGDDTHYDLKSKFNVIKNGVAHPYYVAQDLMLNNGQLRLLDNDKDGVYDVVFIEEYTLHYVDNAFSNEKELTIIDSNGSRKTVQRENLTVTDGLGVAMSLSKIATDSVVKLFTTEDGTGCRIVVYKPSEAGVISAISSDDITVSGITYPFSLVYKNNRPNPEPVPGESVNTYIDEVGEILWLERDLTANDSEWTIAYSQKTAIANGLDPSVRFRMYTIQGNWSEYSIAKKIVVDGKSMERRKFAELIQNSSSGTYTQELLRFKLNKNGEIEEIDTVQPTQNPAATSDFVIGDRIGAAMFTSGSSAFWDYHNMVGQAKRDTPVFIIPVVNGTYATTDSNNSLFGISTVYNVCGNNSRKSQNLLGYMPDEYGYPACFVRTTNGVADSIITGGSLAAVESEQAPIMVVEKIEQAAVDGEIYTKVTGRDIDNKGVISFLADSTHIMLETGLLYQDKPECFDERNKVLVSEFLDFSVAELERYTTVVTDIGFGDIIRYQTQSKSVRAVERVFDYDVPNLPVWGNVAENPAYNSWYTVSGGSPGHYNGFYRFQFGSFEKMTKETFTITTLAGLTETYLKTAFTNLLLCDTTGASPMIREIKDLAEVGDANHRVMLYSYNGGPRTVIVYPY